MHGPSIVDVTNDSFTAKNLKTERVFAYVTRTETAVTEFNTHTLSLSSTQMAVVINGGTFRVVEKCNGNVEKMQAEVGGYYELLLRKKKHPIACDAYVNEEGFVRQLSQNDVGYFVARELGFDVSTLLMPWISGPLLITSSSDGRSLTKGNIDKLRKVFDDVIAKLQKEEEEEDSDEEEEAEADQEKEAPAAAAQDAPAAGRIIEASIPVTGATSSKHSGAEIESRMMTVSMRPGESVRLTEEVPEMPAEIESRMMAVYTLPESLVATIEDEKEEKATELPLKRAKTEAVSDPDTMPPLEMME